MNRTQLLLCLLGISATFLEHTEGIIGGDNASEGQFPYQVALQSFGINYCGGSILSERFILTAAHCVVSNTSAFYNFPIEVIAGTTDLKSSSKDRVSVRVVKVYVPKEYDPTNNLTHKAGDIAVLMLTKDLGIVGNSKLAKIELPSKNETYVGLEANVTGFGHNSVEVRNNTETKELEEFNSISFGKLRYAKARVMSLKDSLPYFTPNLTETQMCAALVQRNEDKPEGLCSGDSGDPLVYNGIQIGIANSSPRGCSEAHEPSIYTRVSSFIDFINKIVDDKIDDSIRVNILEIE